MIKLKLKYRILIKLLNLFSKTWRYKIIGTTPKSPSIIAFWHGKMLPVWNYFSSFKPNAIVSPSKDGEILTQLLIKWQYTIYRGSSSNNGKEVLNLLVDNASKGFTLITPDGPRGPIYKMKVGAAVSSYRAQIPLVLCGVEIKNKIVFNKSWDKFELPLPFSKIILHFSEEKFLNSNLSKDEIDKKIDSFEFELNKLNKLC